MGQECRQCGHCCSYGSGFLIGDDLKNIAKFLGITEKELTEKYLEEKELFNTRLLRPKLITKGKPYGKCIFLENKKSPTKVGVFFKPQTWVGQTAKAGVRKKALLFLYPSGILNPSLSNKKCKIHKVKPLQCKVGNCNEYGEQLSVWFTLNYLVNKDDPESIRQYASYLKSGGKTIDGGKLEELVPDKKKLKKILSFEELK